MNELTESEKKALIKYKKGELKYKDFQIGQKTGLFKICPTKSYPKYTNEELL